MNEHGTQPDAVLLSVQPVLRTDDMAAECRYYTEALGFAVAWRWGDPVCRAGVSRDGLQLQLVSDGRFSPAHPSTVYFTMRGVDRYYHECVAGGAIIQTRIGDRPFGVRDFRAVDLSGNALGFSEPLDVFTDPAMETIA